MSKKIGTKELIMKLCPKCGKDKWAVQFYRNCSAHDGRQVYCIKCWKEYPNVRAAGKRYDNHDRQPRREQRRRRREQVHRVSVEGDRSS